MKKSTRIQVALALAVAPLSVLGACGVGTDVALPAPNPTDQGPLLNESVTGTVESITQRPNVAEDGLHRLEIMTEDGQVLLAAVTYLNTPITPKSEGMACVELPEELEEGTRVGYSLPDARDNFTSAVNGMDATPGC